MIDFPDNPAPGDLFAPPTSEITYQWNGIGWRVYGAEVQTIGGFNLYKELIAGGGEIEFLDELLAGYDYEIEVLSALPSSNSQGLIMEFSEVGIAGPWAIGNEAGITADGQQGLVPTSLAVVSFTFSVSGAQDAGVVDKTSSLIKVFNHGSATEKTELQNEYFSSAAADVSNYQSWLADNTIRVAKAFRIFWDSATFSAGSTFRIYRRSRQPLSFLTGREPGGMYLHQSLDAAAVQVAGYVPIVMAPGYDYEFKLRALKPVSTDVAIHCDVSNNGGSTWSNQTAWDGFVFIGTGASNIIGDSFVVQDSTSPGRIGYDIASGSSNGANIDVEIWNREDAAERTHIRANAAGTSTAAYNDGMLYNHLLSAQANDAIRFFFDNGDFASGIIDVYRRNRSLTFP